MNWFWKRNTCTETDSESKLEVDDLLLQALLSNSELTKDMAMGIPSIASSIEKIGNLVAMCPLKLYKKINDSNGLKVIEINDYRTTLFNEDTKDTLDGWQMKKAITTDFLLGKGGYVYILKNGNKVESLKYVEDKFVTILKNYNPIFKSFLIMVWGNEYWEFEFLKILRNTHDGASGISLIEQLQKVLETSYNEMIYQLFLVKSGGNKKGFIKSDKRLSQESMDLLKKAWKNLYSNNTENVIVLNEGLSFQEASASALENQILETRKNLNDEIKQIFNIYDNDEQKTFKYAVLPILTAIETACNRDLLLENEKGEYFFKFDTNEMTRASIKERYESYKLAIESGWKMINEIRKDEGLENIEGMNVLTMSLGNVLYNTDDNTYFTPNINTFNNNDGSNQDFNKFSQAKKGGENLDANRD